LEKGKMTVLGIATEPQPSYATLCNQKLALTQLKSSTAAAENRSVEGKL